MYLTDPFLFAFQVLFCLQIFSWASQQDQPFQLSLAEEGKWSNKVLINNVLKLSVKIILPFSTVIFVKEFLFFGQINPKTSTQLFELHFFPKNAIPNNKIIENPVFDHFALFFGLNLPQIGFLVKTTTEIIKAFELFIWAFVSKLLWH